MPSCRAPQLPDVDVPHEDPQQVVVAARRGSTVYGFTHSGFPACRSARAAPAAVLPLVTKTSRAL
jgi:hypothetical protein